MFPLPLLLKFLCFGGRGGQLHPDGFSISGQSGTTMFVYDLWHMMLVNITLSTGCDVSTASFVGSWMLFSNASPISKYI
jgi:hypothetical protein